jgi:SNF family Na+-dependent transporter
LSSFSFYIKEKSWFSFLLGKPLYLMECALGQFSQCSPVTVWKLAPIGRGIGFAMVTISLIVAIYYNILMGKKKVN